MGRGRHGFLSDPSASVQARALAAGVALPPGGSFRDAVLQEVTHRERNLRYAEMVVSVRAQSQVAHLLIDLTDDTNRADRHKSLTANMDAMLRAYETELYEDRYLPSFRRAEAERKRVAERARLEQEAREQQAKDRVTKLSGD